MAFQTALSGLNAAQANLSVTGNNIANSSTNGFKLSRAEFGDIFASSFTGTSSTAIGSGVKVEKIAQQFSQGNVEFTNNNLDLAVNGQGFFIVKDDTGYQYTRAGAYGVDRSGYVVNSRGQKLQMYTVDSDASSPNYGKVNSYTPTDLKLDTTASPANTTTNVELNVNIDAASTTPTTAFSNAGNVSVITSTTTGATIGIGTSNPVDTSSYNFSTSTTVYDSLGGAHTANFYFRKTGNNSWEVYSGVEDGVDNAGKTVYAYSTVHTVTFDNKGVLNSVDGTAVAAGATAKIAFFGGPPPAGTLPMVDGAQPLGFDLDLTGSTQYAGTSNVNSLVQDGYTTGRISSIDIDQKGVVYARYTNGQAKTLGAVALANFANQQGLQPIGDTNWVQTFAAGDVVYGQAGTGTMGQIQSGALESSNVDLSKQLVNMIVAQRDFQANAKMISTEDQITQTIINIR